MKILKHGDLEKLKVVKHFTCHKCGCELEADNTEYQSRQIEYNDIGYFIKCPDCGYEIWSDKELSSETLTNLMVTDPLEMKKLHVKNESSSVVEVKRGGWM